MIEVWCLQHRGFLIFYIIFPFSLKKKKVIICAILERSVIW